MQPQSCAKLLYGQAQGLCIEILGLGQVVYREPAECRLWLEHRSSPASVRANRGTSIRYVETSVASSTFGPARSSVSCRMRSGVANRHVPDSRQEDVVVVQVDQALQAPV